jgi:DNA-binding MarR family transcriptional regulator
VSTPGQDRAAIIAAVTDELRNASGLSVLFSQAVADRVGMNPTDLESFDVLVRHGPMTAGRLAQLTGLTTGAITGLVDRLERRGYARREADPSDRRRVIVRALLENAERELGPAYEVMFQASNELLAQYSDDALATVLDFLQRATAVSAEVIAQTRAETAAMQGTPPRLVADRSVRAR